MNVYAKFLPYLKPYKLRFLQAAIAMITVAATSAISLPILSRVINDAFQKRDTRIIWLVILFLPVLVLVRTIAAYVQNYLMSWLGQRVTQDLREELFRHIHVLGLDFLAENKSGDILSRVTNDLNQVQSTLNFTPLYLVRDSLTVIGLIAAMFALNALFALYALILIPGVSSILIVLGKKMRSSSLQSNILMGQIYSRFQESLQGMLVIKAYNYEEGAIEKFQEENALFFSQMMRYLRATALSGPLMEFIGSLILSVFVFLAYHAISAQHMTPGDAVAFLFAFVAAYAPIKNLGKLQSEMQRGLASGERIFQLLDEKPSVVSKPGAPKFAGLRRDIRVEGLTFHYAGRDRPALKDLSLTLRHGERVAVVGPSGSGKSTLIQLLLRLYDAQQGRILYDGADLRELDIRSVREQIGVVTQDTVLFNDSVFQNIALGRRVVTLGEIEAAAKIADAAGFIKELPQGYQTMLGDRGLKLSGGQRQRLAIARAVLKNPSILVLDEATSHLDSASEEAVQAALDRLMEGRTSLVVAHRLSTIVNSDRICVLQDGELVEEGSHHHLMKRGGLYRKLFEIQTAEGAGAAASEATPGEHGTSRAGIEV